MNPKPDICQRFEAASAEVTDVVRARRRRLHVWTISLGAFLALTACGSSDDGSKTSTDDNTAGTGSGTSGDGGGDAVGDGDGDVGSGGVGTGGVGTGGSGDGDGDGDVGSGGAGGATGGLSGGGSSGGPGTGGFDQGADCPETLPALRSPCDGGECVYRDCTMFGQALATCNDGMWSVATEPCDTVICSTGGPCADDEVCFQSGTVINRECVENTCGTNAISCDCIDGCEGSCTAQSENGAAFLICEPLEPYRECDGQLGQDNNPGCDEGSICNGNQCVPPCADTQGPGADCPAPLTGSGAKVCNFNLCALTCDSGETCPDGMTCDGATCRWP